jgi:hypothetical protein
MTCLKCGKNNFGETIGEFPVNRAILEMSDKIRTQLNASMIEAVKEDKVEGEQENKDITHQKEMQGKQAKNSQANIRVDTVSSNSKSGSIKGFKFGLNDLHTKSPMSNRSSVNSGYLNDINCTPRANKETCNVHKRKIEAYCFKDNEFMCLTCLIENKHRNHEISDIENGFVLGCRDIEDKLSLFGGKGKLNCELLNNKASDNMKAIDADFYYATKKVDMFFTETINSINERRTEIINRLM